MLENPRPQKTRATGSPVTGRALAQHRRSREDSQMLDLVARILPVASAIAVAALTIFNIGYSWRIGLHFLGIIDINNVVYSFGLAFGLLIVLFLFVQWVISLSYPVSDTFLKR